MPFERIKKKAPAPETPEQLFNDLRQRAYPGMLSHQADVTRNYCNEALNEPDVALQLPTGSGKTLVGLILGEWRRRKFEERILYVCPTNQLVYQVANEAKSKYGLRVIPFTKSKHDYSAADKSDYRNAEATAVTSYSSLFNIAPFFIDPQIIILDDVHAAENYIATHWTLHISNLKPDQKSLFTALAAILEPLLPLESYLKMIGKREDAWTRGWVDKLSTPQFYKIIPELIKVFNVHVDNTNLYYPWSVIGSNLKACHLYVGAHEITVRPLIAPTDTHPPFKNAKQRIYMSATLGAGGDLERLTGKTKIKRLEVSSGWDTQGIGRRYFLFPTLAEKETQQLTLSLMKRAGRSLVLVPSDLMENNFRALIEKELEFKIFDATDIETSKDPFVTCDKAVTVVANRYDGIDFPGNECRLLIAQGLPKTTNLQEKFIVSRMSAITLLNDRILTRVVQAIGRCNRSPTDYSAILILGDELLDYLLAKDRRKFLHPELQAEIEVGKEYAKDSSVQDFLEKFDSFLEHEDDWSNAEDSIIELRSDMKQEQLPGTSDLREAVMHEVKYEYCLWHGDYSGALEQCKIVLGKLKDPSLKGYRALWNYLGGSAAFLAYKELGMQSFEPLARQYFAEASKAAPALPWLNNLTASHEEKEVNSAQDDKTLIVVERMEMVLESLGIRHDGGFEAKEKEILDGIMSSDATKFETAQVKLGQLLGYEAGNSETNGAPDPWWQIDETFCFTFEDHSGAESSSRLSVTKARQAITHQNWVRDELGIKENSTIVPVLVTPVQKADSGSLPHLKGVYYWKLSDFQEWSSNALSVIREIRKTFVDSGDLVWRSQAIEKYKIHGLCPNILFENLKKSPAHEILKA
ncbi:MAG: DEAD/DEAH box helicase [Nodosilinea sp.]